MIWSSLINKQDDFDKFIQNTYEELQKHDGKEWKNAAELVKNVCCMILQSFQHPRENSNLMNKTIKLLSSFEEKGYLTLENMGKLFLETLTYDPPAECLIPSPCISFGYYALTRYRNPYDKETEAKFLTESYLAAERLIENANSYPKYPLSSYNLAQLIVNDLIRLKHPRIDELATKYVKTFCKTVYILQSYEFTKELSNLVFQGYAISAAVDFINELNIDNTIYDCNNSIYHCANHLQVLAALVSKGFAIQEAYIFLSQITPEYAYQIFPHLQPLITSLTERQEISQVLLFAKKLVENGSEGTHKKGFAICKHLLEKNHCCEEIKSMIENNFFSLQEVELLNLYPSETNKVI